MATTPTDDTMIVTLRVFELREVVRSAVAEALAVRGQHDLLDLKQVAERYRVGRGSLLAAAKRKEIELSQGPRRKFLVRAGEVERWLTERKYEASSRRAAAGPTDLDQWELEADRVLERAVAAGRIRFASPQEIERLKLERKAKKARPK